MFEALPEGLWPVLAGLAGGIPLGLAARIGRFCTLGALEDFLYGHDARRLRMWAVALAVAIMSATLLAQIGVFEVSQTIYHSVQWYPVAAILGGLVFGYGMTMAGNCGYGALARLGGGDLRSFVIVLVVAITAYMTLSGPFAAIREALFPSIPAEAPQGLGTLAAEAGLSPLIPAVGLATVLLGIAAWSADFRAKPKMWFWGAVVGLSVTSGFALTGWVASHSFDVVPIESHTFTAPLGDSVIFLMTSSGGGAGFGVSSVAGVLIGACLGSIERGHFRWEACEDPRELRRQIFGGALMGVGGVVAFGCSVGQGLSAFATMSYAAPLTLGCIFLGGAVGLRHLVRGFSPD